jgi:hypothetical protein
VCADLLELFAGILLQIVSVSEEKMEQYCLVLQTLIQPPIQTQHHRTGSRPE